MSEKEAKWEDTDDEWTAAINAAHPNRSGAHENYAIAMKMVGHRHSKNALVALVCWLLVERKVTAPSCTCASIMADPTRHFRGCPLREKYPDHPAAHKAPLADRLFDAQRRNTKMEDETCQFLHDVLGQSNGHDYTADHYDSSIEVFGVKEDLILSEEQRQKFWAAGFDRVWTHVVAERHDDEIGVHYYSKEGIVR